MMNRSNLAYDIEEQIELQPQKEKKTEQKQKHSFRAVKYVLILTVAAIYLISKHVAVYETEKRIKDLQTEIAEIDGYTRQKTFELEQSTDLAAIEEKATNELGMQRPENYQIEYVNVELDDVTEVTQNDVEGFANRFGAFMSNLKKNIVGIFSFK